MNTPPALGLIGGRHHAFASVHRTAALCPCLRDVSENFDALQLATRTLWEVKTHGIEGYNPFILQVEINKQIEEARRERALATACGFNFRLGVRSQAHKKALEDAAAEFKGLIEVMNWC